jgi:WD40 repeat protein
VIWSVAFLVDGKHVVGGGAEGKIRRWRVEDDKEVGTPMAAGNAVCNIAVSRDGRWVVGGTNEGEVTVWNAESHSQVTTFNNGHCHRSWVRAVDVSPDATKIATGSEDKTVCVWALSTGRRLVNPFKHDHETRDGTARAIECIVSFLVVVGGIVGGIIVVVAWS